MHKTNPRIQLMANVLKGKIAEEIAKQDYLDNGFQIKKTGIGSDFIAVKNDGDIHYKEYVDVKSGRAKLSKKQIQTKNQLNKKNISYHVYRVTNQHLEFQIKNNVKLHRLFNVIQFDMLSFVIILLVDDPTFWPNCKLDVKILSYILTNFELLDMDHIINPVLIYDDLP